MNQQTLTLCRDYLAAAQRVVAFTGAGISTDSGIADFRGPAGVWTKDPEAEKLSNIHYYLSDPEIRRKAWQARLHSPAFAAAANTGHRSLVELERQGKLHLLITQNIDGLHQAAGSSVEKVVELHGTMREVRCMSCEYRVAMTVVTARLQAGEADPDCPDCGGILKSATISFGQNLIAEDLARAEQAALDCDLMLAIGSTLSVYPAAGLVPLAKQAGARVVIVNGQATELDPLADCVVHGSISEILPVVLAAPD